MRWRRPDIVTAIACLFGALAWTEAPRAQDADMARANQLLEEGRALQRQGQLAKGCAKIEESVAVRAGYAAELALADCHAELGRPARASLELTSIAARAAAHAKVDTQNLATYQQYIAYAQQRMKDLAPKLRGLPRVTITLSAEVAAIRGVSVKLDGVLVDPAPRNAAIAVDPGHHRVHVAAPGKKALAWEADLTTGEKSAVFDAMDDEPAPIDEPPQTPPLPSSTAATGAGAPVTTSVSAPRSVPLPPLSASTGRASPADEPTMSTARKAGIGIGLGAGVAGLAIGVGFGVAGVLRRDEGVDLGCGSPGEPSICASLEADYNRLIAAEIVGFVGAGIGLGLAGVLFFTRPAAAPRSVQVSPAVGPSGAGLWAHGHF